MVTSAASVGLVAVQALELALLAEPLDTLTMTMTATTTTTRPTAIQVKSPAGRPPAERAAAPFEGEVFDLGADTGLATMLLETGVPPNLVDASTQPLAAVLM